MADKSITISFLSATPEGGTSELYAELDNEKNEELYGAALTQFRFGVKAYFRVFRHPSSLSLSVDPSDGAITNEGSGVAAEETEYLTFADSNEASLSRPAKTILATDWLGESLGAVSCQGTAVTASRKGVAVLKITYKADFRRYAVSISERSESPYPVVVMIKGE